MSKMLTGVVTSTKMNKTVVVSVVRTLQHPVYKKTITRSKKYKAHVAEKMVVHEGDRVKMQETRPMSKSKTFQVVRIVEKAVDKEKI